MKPFFTFLFSLTLTPNLYSQVENGLYKGLERMVYTDEHGKVHYYGAPGKWYHENLLLIDNDSVFMYKVPVQIVGKQKKYSASDGAFYYYYGTTKQTDTGTIVSLTMNNCDYCAHEVKIDKATGFMYPVTKVENYRLSKSTNGIKIGNVVYSREAGRSKNFFPPREMFYFDSNNIYRTDPKEQYKLISAGVKNFLQTKELKLDHDTLRISIDRFSDHALVETLDAANIIIDTTGIALCFYSQKELKTLVANSTKPIRYIEIGEIIDYWKAARISLEYVIALPKSIHHFSERKYNNMFEYNKVGAEYVLADELPENSWGLVEQK